MNSNESESAGTVPEDDNSFSFPDAGGDPWRVLIVDDDETDREKLRRWLGVDSERTYILSEAATADEALAKFKSTQPDCLLLDYRLPGFDGIELLRQLTDNQESVTPTVVMVTGFGDESVAVDAMKRGALDYLIKESLTKVTLQKSVANAVEKGRLRSEIRQTQQLLERQNKELKAAREQLVQQNSELRTNQNAMLNIMEDIEREIANRKLSEERFRDIIDSIPQGLLLLDGSCCVKICNRIAGALLGVPKENLSERGLDSALQQNLSGDELTKIRNLLPANALGEWPNHIHLTLSEAGITRQVEMIRVKLGAIGNTNALFQIDNADPPK